jgi:transglycosylase-like protein with SLT domain
MVPATGSELTSSRVRHLIRISAAALFMLGLAASVHGEPVTVTGEQLSFAYPELRFSNHGAGGRQSLSSVLTEGRPSHLSSPATDLKQAAIAAAWQQNLPVPFFVNLIQQESAFQKFAVSRAGALGIAQFMPAVAAWRGLENPFEPNSALVESAKYLAELRKQFGNLGLAAAAYNAGPGRLRSWLQHGRALPAETRHYVLSITGAPVEEWAASPDRAVLPMTSAATPELPQTPQRRRALTRSMPQPSQFAIGKQVPSEILASERAVMARHGWKLSAAR